MNKALLDVTRVFSRSGVTMGTRLSLKSSGYGCDDTMILVEALKQLRSEVPKRTSRVMIDIEASGGLSPLLEQVMSIPQRVRENTTLVMTLGPHGVSERACRTVKEIRKQSGVSLAVLVEGACWAGWLDALETIDAETVIVGRSMVIAHLNAGCSMQLLDISELCEKKGARLMAQGDFTEQQMERIADAGVTAFLGGPFEASITIQSLEDGGCRRQERDNMVADPRVKELLRHLGGVRALPS